ncbi:MAG: long-chain fatty acid--CoA ligase [Candidatus Synechococcus spongiarum 15L]|uniref:Long-chain fatty acid--CoA ligase n=3 Tax=Candidatus Synechococcus spongiarum TaxID=431041 RepID=A0A1T1D0N2_9SYNE|nr:MAG: long-chain fatty acid--CoA ligase [Candidatus Synechococcus spongiarum 15L]OOV34421.1 long-chain fatty acid--CoA ligase [Candidatus Synechococcus spongiarum LMB bulk15N]
MGWRRMAPYFRSERKSIGLALGLLVPVALGNALQPLLLGQAVSLLRQEPIIPWLQQLGTANSLHLLTGLLALTMVTGLVLQGLLSYTVQSVGQLMTARIRSDLFDHALGLDLSFHVRTPVGLLLTRLTSDVEAVAEMFGNGAIGVLAELVSLLVIGATMLLVDWRLGLLLLLTLIPVTRIVIALQTRYRRANYRVREELGSLNADLQENLQGLEVVQMFRRQARNSARTATNVARYKRFTMQTIALDATISSLLEWVSIAAIALVISLGGWLVLRNALAVGTLVTFVLYAQRLFNPLRQVAERFTFIQSGLTGLQRIGELLDQPIQVRDRPATVPLPRPASAGEVVFEHVTFAYNVRDDVPVIRDLSFRVAPGETVALVGATGSGKSTVINLLCRLWEPQQGRILLDGVNVRDLPREELRWRLGVVLQDTFLFSGDVATNLRLGQTISRTQLQRSCEDLGLGPWIRSLPQGLDTELRERGANLSAGERQLLGVARVALRQPEVLVMDEATAHLDPSTEAALQRDLANLLEQRTAIIIAHRLSTVESADRILVLRRGQLIESGTHEELKARGGLYAQLANLQDLGASSR